MSGRIPTVKAYCCREWPVVPFERMGPCGYCGKVPKVPEEEPDKEETNGIS